MTNNNNPHDLSEILAKFCQWDYIEKGKFLKYAERMIIQHSIVTYKNTPYHLIDDLQVDLEAECKEKIEEQDEELD